MAGLVPAIHVLLAAGKKVVDARHKAGRDQFRLGYFTTSTGQGASRTRRSAVPPMIRS
jgi:hypothetical protein